MFEITYQTMFKDLILQKKCKSNQAASGKKTVGHPTQGLKQTSAFRTRSATLWPCSLTTESDFMAGLPQIIRFRKGINYNQQNYKN
jgi:hypothetical protein